jgi:hypothetical protein
MSKRFIFIYELDCTGIDSKDIGIYVDEIKRQLDIRPDIDNIILPSRSGVGRTLLSIFDTETGELKVVL